MEENQDGKVDQVDGNHPIRRLIGTSLSEQYSALLEELKRLCEEDKLDLEVVVRGLDLIISTAEKPPMYKVVNSSFFVGKDVNPNSGPILADVVKPVSEQLAKFSECFRHLDTAAALKNFENFPPLPDGAENWFVVPRWEKVADNYLVAIEHIFSMISRELTFRNIDDRALNAGCMRQKKFAARALQMIGNKQDGDFLIIPAQLGLSEKNRHKEEMRIEYAPAEFGLGVFAVGCIILSHLEHIKHLEALLLVCDGDECYWKGGRSTSSAPVFFFLGSTVNFGGAMRLSGLKSASCASGLVIS